MTTIRPGDNGSQGQASPATTAIACLISSVFIYAEHIGGQSIRATSLRRFVGMFWMRNNPITTRWITRLVIRKRAWRCVVIGNSACQ